MSTRAPPTVPESPIPIALAAVFAGIAVLTTMLAVAYRTPVPLAVAAPFGLSASLVWYHATGRLHRRLRRDAFAGGRFGGGRADRGRPGDRRRANRDAEWARHDATAGGVDGRRTDPRWERTAGGRDGWPGDATGDRVRQPSTDHATPTRAEAYEALDLEPGADAEAVRAAYRSKVKEVHPDVDGGDEAAFREVTAAYERLDG